MWHNGTIVNVSNTEEIKYEPLGNWYCTVEPRGMAAVADGKIVFLFTIPGESVAVERAGIWPRSRPTSFPVTIQLSCYTSAATDV